MADQTRSGARSRALRLGLVVLAASALAASFLAGGCGGGGGGAIAGAPQGGLPSVGTFTPAFLAILPAAQKGSTLVGSQACAQCHGSTATAMSHGTFRGTARGGPLGTLSGGLDRAGDARRTSFGSRGMASSHARVLQASPGTPTTPPPTTTTPTTTPTNPLTDVSTAFEQSVHAAQGVGCESCHGPGSAHVAAGGGKTNILTFPDVLSGEVCGQCHTQIHKDWAGSAHHEVVDDAITVGLAAGGLCLRCHSDQYRVQVLELGRTPATDLTVYTKQQTVSASCATCHNPHKNTGNLDLEGKEVLLREAISNTDPAQVGPGATPAAYSTFNQICARCHNGRGGDPSDAALQKNTVRPGLHEAAQYNMLAGISGVDLGQPIVSTAHFEAPGQCTHCHMSDNPGSHSFTVKLDNCAPCHTDSDAAARENALKNEIVSDLLSLRTRLSTWSTTTFKDPDLWNYTSNIQALNKTPPDQKLVPIQVKRARHNYYFVVYDNSFGVHNGKYTRFLLDVAQKQLDQLNVAPASAFVKGRAAEAQIKADRLRAARADAEDPSPY